MKFIVLDSSKEIKRLFFFCCCSHSGPAYLWRPNNNSHTPTFCHLSRQESINSCWPLPAHWAATYNASVEKRKKKKKKRRCSDERNHDNCFGHNRNLPARPSNFLLAITEPSYRVLVNKTGGSSRLAELCRADRQPPLTCSSLPIKAQSVMITSREERRQRIKRRSPGKSRIRHPRKYSSRKVVTH